MSERSYSSTSKLNQAGRPIRRRNISFCSSPLHEGPTPMSESPMSVLVDYASVRERKQLKLSSFLHSDNPITFFLSTFWHILCLFAYLFILPFILIKRFYLLTLQVYGVRRPPTSNTISDLFSIISSQLSSTSQQSSIVWILTTIDCMIIQLMKLPDIIIHSIRKHIDGTVLKSFNLIDGWTNHQITKTYFMFRSIIIKEQSFSSED